MTRGAWWLLAAALLALALVGCGQGPTPPERLFVVDGCTVYRFVDEGSWRYFTNCSATWLEPSRATTIPGGV